MNIQKLERRRAKNPILDFEGHKYSFPPVVKPPPLSNNNKMELLNFSQDNTFYLFFNRMNLQLCIYEMCEVTVGYDEMASSGRKLSYQFVLRHVLQYDRSALFQHFYAIGIDPVNHFRKNVSQIMIDNKGCVKLSFVESLPFIDKMN